MDSRLQVDSQFGQGSLFWADLDLQVKHRDSICDHPSTVEKIVGIQGHPPSVLIVEDSREDGYLMAHFLQSIGCITYMAMDGLTGLEMAKKHEPDLILTDLIMHTFDGIEFLKALRQCSTLVQTPVVVVSASVFRGDQEKSLAAGATAFLPKPLNFSALLDVLQEQLDVDWIYEAQSSTLAQSTPSFKTATESLEEANLIPPKLETVKELHHLAMMGNLHEIEGRLKDIADEGQHVHAFVQTLNTLVENFQVKQIKTLLQSYLPSDYSL